MDAYDNYSACGQLSDFVDALSNWYVRRSRDRFWSSDKRAADKLDAYWTLYECLVTTAKLIAPFVPFIAEAMWRNLAVAEFRGGGQNVLESVHLCDYPTGDPAAIDEALSTQMRLVREIVSLGRSARVNAKLKVRQPLQKVEVILVERSQQRWLEAHRGLIAEELNVKQVEFTEQAERYISYAVLPDLKRLGPRIGKRLPAFKLALAALSGAALLASLETHGKAVVDLPDGPVEIDKEDLQVRLSAKEGWAAAQGPSSVVVLSTELTAELISEGHAREVVHLIQGQRKELDCQYTDRIEVGWATDDADLAAAIETHSDYIQQETLATRLVVGPIGGVAPLEAKIGAAKLTLYVQVAKS